MEDERGAVAVVVGLMLVVLVGFAAIAVDVGAMYSQRAQLQNAADAAALAAAQVCAKSTDNCANPTSANAAALSVLAGNVVGATPSMDTPIYSQTSRTVTVTTRSNVWTPFASASGAGKTSSPVAAQATAQWSTTTVGGATVPFAISACVVPNDNTSTSNSFIPIDNSYCSGSVSGGFGWLDDGTDSCLKNITIPEFVSITTGNTGKCSLTDTELQTAAAQLGCTVTTPPAKKGPDDVVQFLQCLVGKTVYVPVYDSAAACLPQLPPSGKNYCIARYAIFEIYGLNVKINGSDQLSQCMTGRTCQLPGNNGALGFQGQFIAYSTNSASWTGPGGTATTKVTLIQ